MSIEIADLKRVDELWAPTQPYIVAQIMDEYGKTSGDALELGPFAGGIAKENLLDEIFRIMKQGGLAFIGGGHGRGVPQHIINEIANDLRTLHGKLGGRYLSIADLNRVVSRSSIKDKYLIKEDGGKWLNIRK